MGGPIETLPKDARAAALSSDPAHPVVSVVIPTYNRAGLIHATIDSVLKQTYDNLEIVIVDDRSSDGTADVVGGLRDERIVYLRNEGPKGAAGARNFGIARTHGKYVALLDSDDQWYEEKLEMQVSILESDAKLGAVSCGWQWVNMHTLVPRIVRKPDAAGRIDDLPRWFFNICQDLLLRTDIAKSVLFDEALRTYEVLDWVVRVFKATTVSSIDRILVDCYDHEQARNSDGGATRLEVLETILARHAAFMQGDPHAWAVLNRMLGAGLLMGKGDRQKARGYLMRSLRADPRLSKSWGYAAATLIPGAPGMLRRLKSIAS